MLRYPSSSFSLRSLLAYTLLSFPLISSASISNDPKTLDGKSFDFVIVGGGVAGLALASRLSENKDWTVALIEAGTDGSAVKDNIYIPGYSYIHGLTVGEQYDWGYTISQSAYSNGKNTWPRGKVLGGSGAVNGLFWCRGSQPEYDAWAKLNPNSTEDWSWNNFNAYMKKVETLHPPDSGLASEFAIQYDANAHGTNGPVGVGWSGYIFDPIKHWVPTWIAMGLRHGQDGADGNNRGVTMTPSSLNTANMSRSDPMAAYINPLPPRSNLVILTEHMALKINFGNDTQGDGNVVAESVLFGATDWQGQGNNTYTVKANKEVILSGGSINSPQLLQLSGVGPAATLDPLGIPVVINLPGVGHNLQDHAATALYYDSNDAVNSWSNLRDNATLAAEQLTLWENDQTSQWSYVNEGIGYPALGDLLDSATASTVQSNAQAGLGNVTALYQSMFNPDPTILAGQQAQHEIHINEFLNSDVGLLEILMTPLGGGGGQMGFQIALQHPLSRGAVLINSADPYTIPVINPAYLSQQLDADLLRYGVAFVRKLVGTAPMNTYVTDPVYPTADVSADNDVEAYIRGSVATEYHPMGTCSMLPLDQGGVVNTSLVVYGTTNLRVVDASIMPLEISAHLMISTYGVAEKAADIIKAVYTGGDASNTVAGSNGSVNNTSTPGSKSALSTAALIGIGVGGGVLILALLGLLIFCCRRRREDDKYRPNDSMDQLKLTSAGADMGYTEAQHTPGMSVISPPLQPRGSVASGAGFSMLGSPSMGQPFFQHAPGYAPVRAASPSIPPSNFQYEGAYDPYHQNPAQNPGSPASSRPLPAVPYAGSPRQQVMPLSTPLSSPPLYTGPQYISPHPTNPYQRSM